MDQILPYANVVAGVLVLLIGVGIHFGAHLPSVVDWERATGLGLQEAGVRREYRSYEHAIAVSDVLIGWTYASSGPATASRRETTTRRPAPRRAGSGRPPNLVTGSSRSWAPTLR